MIIDCAPQVSRLLIGFGGVGERPLIALALRGLRPRAARCFHGSLDPAPTTPPSLWDLTSYRETRLGRRPPPSARAPNDQPIKSMAALKRIRLRWPSGGQS
ncbi:hypothetical protein BZL29_4772 [Mycobacterium kansasii]|uniref:Uncharacterized protein n=1 Tax=Mycobacterium kansasii TaxID=1768 RepID=A0A1V3X1J1_MYCKA|nr:hypothetical protein BZL29_4772 [Mycobacterium kansasii]